jgi:hypothetical protein
MYEALNKPLRTGNVSVSIELTFRLPYVTEEMQKLLDNNISLQIGLFIVMVGKNGRHFGYAKKTPFQFLIILRSSILMLADVSVNQGMFLVGKIIQ